MERKIIFVLMSLMLAHLLSKNEVCAQSLLTFVKTDWDTAYIERYPTRWSLRLYEVSKNLKFTIDNKANGESTSFDPNSKAAIGIGGSYLNYAIDLGINVSNRKNDPQNSTNSFDFISTLYAWQHIFDFNFQWYSGFFSDYHDPHTNEFVTEFRSDIRTFNLGISYCYNFNFRKFSFNAPFVGTCIQKKSAGAPIAGIFFTYYDLRANTPVIPDSTTGEFDSSALISEANLVTAGFLGGYAYTFVLPKHFFITLSLTPGISFNAGDAKSINYYSIGHPVTVSPKLMSRLAMGYAGKKIYVLISYQSDQNYVNMGHKTQLNYNLSKFKLVGGFRIK